MPTHNFQGSTEREWTIVPILPPRIRTNYCHSLHLDKNIGENIFYMHALCNMLHLLTIINFWRACAARVRVVVSCVCVCVSVCMSVRTRYFGSTCN